MDLDADEAWEFLWGLEAALTFDAPGTSRFGVNKAGNFST